MKAISPPSIHPFRSIDSLTYFALLSNVSIIQFGLQRNRSIDRVDGWMDGWMRKPEVFSQCKWDTAMINYRLLAHLPNDTGTLCEIAIILLKFCIDRHRVRESVNRTIGRTINYNHCCPGHAGPSGCSMFRVSLLPDTSTSLVIQSMHRATRYILQTIHNRISVMTTVAIRLTRMNTENQYYHSQKW